MKVTRETMKLVIKIAYLDGCIRGAIENVEDAYKYADRELDSGMVSILLKQDSILQDLRHIKDTLFNEEEKG